MKVTVWDPDFLEGWEVESSKMKELTKGWGQLTEGAGTYWEANTKGKKEGKKNELSQKPLWNDHDLLHQQVLVANLHVDPFKIDHIAGCHCNNLKDMWLHWYARVKNGPLRTWAKPTKEKWPRLSSLCSSWIVSEGPTPSWVISLLLPWGIPTSILMEEKALHGGGSSLPSVQGHGAGRKCQILHWYLIV